MAYNVTKELIKQCEREISNNVCLFQRNNKTLKILVKLELKEEKKNLLSHITNWLYNFYDFFL